MLWIVLAFADRLMPVRLTAELTGWLFARRFGARRVIVAGVAAVPMAVMTDLTATTSMIFGRCATVRVVMRPVGMAATIAMVVQRRRHRIGEQIARQQQPHRKFSHPNHVLNPTQTGKPE